MPKVVLQIINYWEGTVDFIEVKDKYVEAARLISGKSLENADQE